MMSRWIFACVAMALIALPPLAEFAAADVAPRPGWNVIKTPHSFKSMVKRLNKAVRAEKMLLVTRASASAGARAAKIKIPGNMIIGVYRNDFARRMLKASVAAGIEAPIRFYLTQTPDGTTLSYRTPTAVFAPYAEEGGDALATLAGELDDIFARIAAAATR